MAADMLDVTAKTIRNWEKERSPIPYTAFKVMRHLAGYLLAGEKWEGWTITQNKLFSPEGRSFEPHELRYISHYFTMARLFLKQRENPNPQTIAQQPALSGAARSVSPAPLPRLEALADGAGTLTLGDAALLRRSVVSVQPLLGQQTKPEGGEIVQHWCRFGSFVNYLPTANDECFAEVL